MAINIHPEQGTIVICDFKGFVPPEMVKRRPAIVISPRLRRRDNLCAIIPLSTSSPNKIEPYHYKLHVDPVLPNPYSAKYHWVKADMIYTVSFNRLYLPHNGKDSSGKRQYVVRIIDRSDLIKIQQCVLNGLGLKTLTDYL